MRARALGGEGASPPPHRGRPEAVSAGIGLPVSDNIQSVNSRHSMSIEPVRAGLDAHYPTGEPMSDIKRLAWSVDEVAAALDVHSKTVLRAIKDGELTCATLGRKHLITAADLDQWLQRRGSIGLSLDALLSQGHEEG